MKNLKEKKASQIFEIIRKLTKDEKRAFKLYATTYERKGNTVISLFDLIYEYTHLLPADSNPREKDIQIQLQREGLAVQYISSKNRLKKLLLDFLYEQNSKEDETEQLHRKLCIANVLLNKGHMEAGTLMLQEAKRTAIDYEDYELCLSCIQVEIYTLSNNGSYTAEMQRALLAEMKVVIEKIERFSEAICATNAARESHLQKKLLPLNLPGIEELIRMIEEEDSVKIKNQYYLILAAVSVRCDPPAVTARYVSAHIKMLEENIKPNAPYIMRYFVAFGSYMPALLSLGQTDTYRDQLRKIESKYALYSAYLTPASDIFVLLNIYKYKLAYHRYLNNCREMLPVVQQAEESFAGHYKMITDEGIILYTALLRNSYFFCGQYAKAHEWATKNLGQILIPQTVLLAAYIVEMLSGYELGQDMDTLRSKVKKIKYHLAGKVMDATVTKYMEELIDLIIGLVNARNAEETISVIENIKQHYCIYMQDANPAITGIIRNSYIQYWLDKENTQKNTFFEC